MTGPAEHLARSILAAADALLADLRNDGITDATNARALAAAEAGRAYVARGMSLPFPAGELLEALEAAAVDASGYAGIGGDYARRLERLAGETRARLDTGAPVGPCEALRDGAPFVPRVGAMFDAIPCPGKPGSGRACGSPVRVLLSPERMSGDVPPARRGWWNAECPRCGDRSLWRPDRPPAGGSARLPVDALDTLRAALADYDASARTGSPSTLAVLGVAHAARALLASATVETDPT